ncbi:MAG: uncharacterized protein JWN55_250 [Frankiales bacterium]|jgi:uncharacterized protein (DUF58 family)|nr:uncharacterized protein [Frankiales bacterium]
MSAGTLLAKGSRARRLYFEVGHKVDGSLHGEHLGVLAGSGGDLAEARLYEPGDDVRRLDWAVLARTGEPYVRTTLAQRELETTFVVDLTPSMAFGTRVQDKKTLALTAVAAFSHLASGPGDRIGAVVLTTAGVRRVPGRPTGVAAPHLLSLLDRTAIGEGPAPSLTTALRAVPVPRRGLVVVVSDLLGDRDWAKPLRVLAQRHDVIVVQVHDPRELSLPDVGMLRVVDPETGRTLDVPTGSKALRARYAAAARARQDGLAELVRAAGAAHLPLSTDGDWLQDLTRFLTLRRRVRSARRVAGR